MSLQSLALALVDAPSPSGEEGPALRLAERALRNAGLRVERQEVGGPQRFNLFARRGRPRVTLTTHVDTVPGPLPVRVDSASGVLFGRGACDAKGIAAAMIEAARELAERGATDFAVLLVVGEETTSDGAIAAARLAESELASGPRAALFGEPTGMRWIDSHPGVLLARLHADGRPGHSSDPSSGSSAVHALLDALQRLRTEPWPASGAGPARLNVGRIEGGEAFNVLAARARADVMLRSGGDPDVLLGRMSELCGGLRLDVACASRPVAFAVPEGVEGRPAAFATDAPFLAALGTPSLLGPGEIRHAHADDEQVRLADLAAARDAYAGWVLARLQDER